MQQARERHIFIANSASDWYSKKRNISGMSLEDNDRGGMHMDKMLEAIEKMSEALQELKEAVLELKTEEPPIRDVTVTAAEQLPITCAPEAVKEEITAEDCLPVPEPVSNTDSESAHDLEPAFVTVSEPAHDLEPAFVTVSEPASAPEDKPQDELRCPVCGNALKPGDRFCMSCGTAVQKEAAPAAPPAAQKSFCMNCGSPLRPGDRFCMKCGQKTEA